MNPLIRFTMPVMVSCALCSGAWAQTATSTEPAASALAAASTKAARVTVEAEAARVAALATALTPRALTVESVALEIEAMALAQAAVGAAGTSSQDQRKRELVERDRVRARAEARRDQSLYSKGTSALDAGRWTQAVEAFTAAAALKGSRADGALYWKAYAEYKLTQKAAALATLQDLKTSYPGSQWLKEARALEVEMSGSTAASAASATDDDLKLLAINGLMHSDDERAVPMLEKILTSQQPPQLKKRALFVLSQSKTPRAREVLLGVVKGSSNPDLQLEALRYFGMIGGTQNLQVLSEIYASSKDIDVRRRILETYMIAGQRDLVLQAAKSESDAALRGQAVHLLGVMRATAELDTLYQAEQAVDVRRAIIDAFMVGGDSDRLVQVAKTDKDARMRLRAIEMLGAMGRGKNTAFMSELYYAEGQSIEARRAVINGLFVAGDSKTLVEIARKELDPTLRKALVGRLSLMKSKEATDFLVELINK